ncbi:response regulator [Aurantimonas sp. VKM B-3413]|uniref:response regulator n=1 Tax=Aurantimonas sp. VKM B-3413 TaxID=2779401 RepID=UPI001E466419|nr:response regulator [Aurantimonas sp. VKM B-3413]MCB8840520.1 response regulator [Aurantimonas sp. VKM B-3413]
MKPFPTPKAGTVLVVEDEPFLRMDLVDTLEDAGFACLEAANADEAMRTLKAIRSVEVLLTDVHMPGTMDGIELARLTRNGWPQTAIIVVSGHRRVEAADLPSNAFFVAKPYGPDVIIAAVIKAVELRCGGIRTPIDPLLSART